MFNLAVSYENGKGIEVNLQEALRLYIKASSLGDVDSMYRAGLFYEQGKTSDKNISLAKQYFQMAAAKNNEDAKKKLL